MKVATFNCNGSSHNPFYYKRGDDCPSTRLLQNAVETNLKTVTKTVACVVGSSLNFLPIHDAVQDLVASWLRMPVGDFYRCQNIAAWKLTSIVDLQVKGVIYPWGSLAPMRTEDVDDLICKVIQPVPAVYNLPSLIVKYSEELQRTATHFLVQIMWSLTPVDLLVPAYAEMRVYMDTIKRKTADQILECCCEHDIVLVQEVTLEVIEILNDRDDVVILFYPKECKLFYSAIVYENRPDITLLEWGGDDKIILCNLMIEDRAFAVGSIHAVAGAACGAVGAVNSVIEYASLREIDNVIVGGDANTMKGVSEKNTNGVVSLGSASFRTTLEKHSFLNYVVPMWYEDTQVSVVSCFQHDGTKANKEKTKACDFLACNARDVGYRFWSDFDAEFLPSKKYISDHYIVSAELEWE